MPEVLRPLTTLPRYGFGALIVLLLYAIQSEIRFGSTARKVTAGPEDRGSTWAVGLSSAVPVIGFVLAMKTRVSPSLGLLPGMPYIAWVGVGVGALGLLIRLWSVLTLRDRYTRTLLVGTSDAFERSGPYRFIRHPGYLGSLLTLNGIALASGDLLTLTASLVVTSAAYAYRIRVEDAMLVGRFGATYQRYRAEVGALIPVRVARNT
jgi:protein-S-isoprenylcysteine O-methyltransferase Ste14